MLLAPPALLAASHAFCRRRVRRHARSFFFASTALPREKKRAAFAVYAFCRHADDLADKAGPGPKADAALAQLGLDYDEILRQPVGRLPFAPAFAWAVHRFQLDKEPFLLLLKGVSMDLGPVRMADWPQLRDYCYHVASVVGLIMARIFELRDPAGREHAVDLGIAMQLTNIIRDVREDHALGRVYLPADEMAAHGVRADDLAGPGEASVPLRKLLRAQIDRAREYYARAEQGIPLLADDGSQLTAWLMRHVYAGILEEVEALDCNVTQGRASTSFARKLALGGRAWRDWRRRRRGA